MVVVNLLALLAGIPGSSGFWYCCLIAHRTGSKEGTLKLTFGTREPQGYGVST